MSSAYSCQVYMHLYLVLFIKLPIKDIHPNQLPTKIIQTNAM